MKNVSFILWKKQRTFWPTQYIPGTWPGEKVYKLVFPIFTEFKKKKKGKGKIFNILKSEIPSKINHKVSTAFLKALTKRSGRGHCHLAFKKRTAAQTPAKATTDPESKFPGSKALITVQP